MDTIGRLAEAEQTLNTLQVTTTHSKERVSDLLCCALEGGSNYWYLIEDYIKPPKLDFMSDNPTGQLLKPRVYRHLDYPLNTDGALLISDAKACTEGKKRTERLDITSCQRGLQVMAEKYPRHYASFVQENEDAETGDVFLQCALFGELVYG